MPQTCVYCRGSLVYRQRVLKPVLRRCKGCGHERELTRRDFGTQVSVNDVHEAWLLSK